MFRLITSGIKQKVALAMEKVVGPLSIRKVKLREEKILINMGFSPERAKRLINYGINYQLLHEGLGQLIWRTAKLQNISPREAGERLSDGLYWYEWRIKIAAERRIK